MKPLHIALLLAAGAVGGAIVLKISERPPAAVVAQRVPQMRATPQTPATAPPPAFEAPRVVAPSAEPAAESAEARATGAVAGQPSPFETPKESREAPQPGRAHRAVEGKVNANPDVRTTARRQSTKAGVLAVSRRQPIESPSIFNQPIRSQPTASQPTEPPPPTASVLMTPPPAESAPAPLPIPPARTEPEYATPPPPAPPEPHKVTLNAGTLIPVRLVDGLTSERNLPGDSFTATLDKALVVDGFVIAERGARVEGRVLASDRGGRVKGVASLQVELARLHLSDGQSIAVQTDGFDRRADTSRNEDATKVGAGAAIGAIIGAVAGGGKGAAIGAGVGGAAGAGDVLATRGKAATLPSETRVTFRMRASVTITEKLPGY